MFPIRHIVFPTDFSDFARQALDRAASLAKGNDAELTVVHVLQPITQVASIPVGDMTLPNIDERLREVALDGLSTLATALTDDGVKVSTVLREGRPADEILAVAEERGADLIVISTHGRTGLSRMLVGSVAEQVIRAGPCPVLVWRPQMK